MTFSSCSDYLLVKEAEPQPVSVIPLPENLRHGAPRSTKPEAMTLQQKGPENFTEQPILHSKDVFDSSFRPGQILHNPTVISARSGSLSSLSFRSGNAVTMDLSSTCANYQKASQSFEVISLPQWEGMQHTTPTIIIPSSDQMAVKIVLNKALEDEYTLSRPAGMGLPLVMTRDFHAIRRVVAEDLEPSGIRMLLNPEEQEEFAGRGDMITRHDNMRKRKLIVTPEMKDGRLEDGAGKQSIVDDGGDGASGDPIVTQHFQKKRTL